MRLPINLRPVNEEAWLNSQVGPYAVCGTRSVARIGFGVSVSVCQCHIPIFLWFLQAVCKLKI